MKKYYHFISIVGITVSMGLVSQEVKTWTSCLIIGSTIYFTYKAIKNHEHSGSTQEG